MIRNLRTIFNLLMVATLAMFVLAACSSTEKDTSKENKQSKTEETKVKEEAKIEVTQEKPIFVDEKNKVVKVYATVNGKYLVTPTRHGLNWVEGKYGDQAVLKGYGNPLDFHDALIKIGGVPAVEKGGDTTKEFEETPEGKFIKGDQVAVKITWEGAKKEYDINEVMLDSTGKKLEYHFGGNYDTQDLKMTGCYMCFDSCPAGITSNASHPVGTFESGAAEFHGNPEVLPADGTPVVLTYSIVQ
ncbi:hypothetical protein HHO41_13735 [Bacillus sp. DNRA2]|uniref:YdjY domain-containing protein n=1 Tax=Bacillus sp. DNRA2 TaxID=2723053 RepID=UPI00145D0138|nr:YdjY domain-containing protein [Bacillus sp. DNRA2]NMD71361.1 hypothetical protein [Bacillus sp. DNRA2]